MTVLAPTPGSENNLFFTRGVNWIDMVRPSSPVSWVDCSELFPGSPRLPLVWSMSTCVLWPGYLRILFADLFCLVSGIYFVCVFWKTGFGVGLLLSGSQRYSWILTDLFSVSVHIQTFEDIFGLYFGSIWFTTIWPLFPDTLQIPNFAFFCGPCSWWPCRLQLRNMWAPSKRYWRQETQIPSSQPGQGKPCSTMALWETEGTLVVHLGRHKKWSPHVLSPLANLYSATLRLSGLGRGEGWDGHPSESWELAP